MSSRFGTSILEKLCSEVVFADVMIDDKLSACESSQNFRHWTELSPRARIENDQTVPFDFFWVNALSKYTDVLSRVKESQGGWSWMAVDDRNLFAHRLEDSGHTNFATESIAIGPYVAGQDKTAVRVEDRNQTVPSE
jgi:hypothetical protein